MPKPTPQDFITWTNTLVQFPWPIQLNDFPPLRQTTRLDTHPTTRRIQRM